MVSNSFNVSLIVSDFPIQPNLKQKHCITHTLHNHLYIYSLYQSNALKKTKQKPQNMFKTKMFCGLNLLSKFKSSCFMSDVRYISDTANGHCAGHGHEYHSNEHDACLY